jgi:peroxidase
LSLTSLFSHQCLAPVCSCLIRVLECCHIRKLFLLLVLALYQQQASTSPIQKSIYNVLTGPEYSTLRHDSGGHFGYLTNLGTNPSINNNPSIDHICALVFPGQTIQHCITYGIVNAAFKSAVEKLDLPMKMEIHESFNTDEINNLGRVIEETTKILAETYKLNTVEVFESLSRIDTKRTIISKYCPLNLQRRKCKMTRYRAVDGSCNNLENSQWGSAMTTFSRLFPADYGDGINSPRRSYTGRELPSARLISSQVHTDDQVSDQGLSLFSVAWGQFITHDIKFGVSVAPTPNCCSEGPSASHSRCLPIKIPDNDIFYSRFNQTCMNFFRSVSGLKNECKLGSREQINLISPVLDANTVYSNDEQLLRSLRTFSGGKMKTYKPFSDLGLKDLLPLKLENPDVGCIRPNTSVHCFLTGEARANEHNILVLHHTLLLREHNRLAEELASINPRWSDETIFQEARHIVAALVQHITFTEYLPHVLGSKGLHDYGLTSSTHGYYSGYNKNINPTMSTGFATAAFRFGHSSIPNFLERWSPSHEFISSKRLSTMLLQPFDLLKPWYADQYMLGMLNKPALEIGESMTKEVTHHLFERPGQHFGLDLASLNIQRGRDHGIPSFNRWREWCGLKPVHTWQEAGQVFTNHSAHSYPKIYASPEDIDLWSGGLSERPESGALLGPTFTCILGRQFFNLRAGDRFWYENSGWPSSFTPQQLQQIRRQSLARLICANSDGIESIQQRALLLPDTKTNPRVYCHQIPKLDLSWWTDLNNKY